MAAPMPVSFVVDSSSNAVLTTASGIVCYDELVQHIQSKKSSGLMCLPELFDARDINLDLSTSQLLCLSDKVVSALEGKPPGKIAAVTNSAFIYGMARGYATLTKGINPKFAIFHEMEEARAWLLQPDSEESVDGLPV